MEMCPQCRGQGHIIAQSFGLISVQIPCHHCQTKGMRSTKSNCTDCSNSGKIKQEKKYRISINAGILDQAELSMPTNSSDYTLVFIIKILPSEHGFVRREHDLLWEQTIDWKDSILGKELVISHPSGNKITINTSQFGPLMHTQEYKIPQKGYMYQSQQGDFILRFKVVNVPASINEEQRKLLEPILKSIVEKET